LLDSPLVVWRFYGEEISFIIGWHENKREWVLDAEKTFLQKKIDRATECEGRVWGGSLSVLPRALGLRVKCNKFHLNTI